MSLRKPKRLQCEFAVLDIKNGRVILEEYTNNSQNEVEVIVTGRITGPHSRDDGISTEFLLDVDKIQVV
jgi:hypothetical protein